MCDNLKPDHVRLNVCRTINLAKHANYAKPDMQMYDKTTLHKINGGPYSELPMNQNHRPEYNMRGTKPIKMPKFDGKFMYLAKAGILVGAVYFTYTQGVWGDQQDVTDCMNRWQEYVRGLYVDTQRPPTFEPCENTFQKENVENLIAPLYSLYKSCVTTCFTGLSKVPLIIKGQYIEYYNVLKKNYEEIKDWHTRKKS